MASLLGLPNELLLSILSFADPDDLVNFAVTCKHIFAVAEIPLREHKALQQKYRSVDVLHEEDECASWNLLYNVLLHPRAALYVRELNLAADRKSQWETHEEWYAVAMEQSRTLDPAWHELVSYGNDDLLVECLLPRLLRLRKLSYVPNSGDTNLFFQAVVRAAQKYKKAELQALPPLKLPFQHLTTVFFEHWDTEGSMPFLWLLYFSRIPSVRSVSGHMVGDGMASQEDLDRIGSGNELLPSKAMSLRLNYSCVGMENLGLMLSGMPELRNFSYDYGGAIVDDEEWDPKGILKLVSKYLKDSLESFELTDSSWSDIESDIGRVSLSNCKNLRTLFIDWEALLPDLDVEENEDLDDTELSQGFYAYTGDKQKPIPYLSNLLPPCLEQLDLKDCKRGCYDVVVKLMQNKPEECPKLKQLTLFVQPDIIDEELTPPKMSALEAAAKKVGVDLSVRKESPADYSAAL